MISTAGDATLSVADVRAPDLVNGTFSLPRRCSGVGRSAGRRLVAATDYSDVGVTVNFKQPIGANDALRTGAYSKTLTFTLSTTTP